MQSRSLFSLWRQRLIRGSCALAFVSSLALYHKTVLVSSVTLAQKQWEANRVIHRDRLGIPVRPNAIAPGIHAVFQPAFWLQPSDSWEWQWSNNIKFNSSQ